MLPSLALPPAMLPSLALPPAMLPSLALPPAVLPSLALPPAMLPSLALPPAMLPSLALPPELVLPSTKEEHPSSILDGLDKEPPSSQDEQQNSTMRGRYDLRSQTRKMAIC